MTKLVQILLKGKKVGEGEFTATVKSAWLYIYPPDGVNFDKQLLNGSKDWLSKETTKSFSSNWLSYFSSFIGLANRKLDRYEGQSWKNIGRNFVGWQKNKSYIELLALAAIMIPINLCLLPLKLFLNVIKLFTEFLPALSIICLHKLMHQLVRPCWKRLKKLSNTPQASWRTVMDSLLNGLVLLTLGPLFGIGLVFSFYWYFFGNCLTDPIQFFSTALEAGDKFAGTRGKICLASLAAIQIAVVYTVFFPLLFKILAPTLIAPLIPHLPVSLLAIINWSGWQALGTSSLGMSTLVLGGETFGLSLLVTNTTIPIAAAWGFITGLFLCSVGYCAERLMQTLSNTWHKSAIQSQKETPCSSGSSTNYPLQALGGNLSTPVVSLQNLQASVSNELWKRPSTIVVKKGKFEASTEVTPPLMHGVNVSSAPQENYQAMN